MADETAVAVPPTAHVEPTQATSPIPEIPEREKLAAAIDAEKKSRSRKVMALIEQICKENNCKFIAQPFLVEQPTGGFVVAANPGVVAL